MRDMRSAMTIDEVAETLGISRALAYESARRGDLPVLKLGRRLLVPRQAFNRWMESPGRGRTSQPTKQADIPVPGAIEELDDESV